MAAGRPIGQYGKDWLPGLADGQPARSGPEHRHRARPVQPLNQTMRSFVGSGEVQTDSEATGMIRGIGCLAVVVSAVVHLYLWFDGVKDQGTVGALFVVNVVAGLAIAVMLLRWRHWIPLLLLAGFGATTFGAFLIA